METKKIEDIKGREEEEDAIQTIQRKTTEDKVK